MAPRRPLPLRALVVAAALLVLAAAQTSPTSSRTSTPTQTPTRSPSAAVTNTRSPSAAATGTRTPTATATATRTGTQSATGSATATKTASSSGTLPTGVTPSNTPTPSGTVTSGVTDKLSLSSGRELYQYSYAGTGVLGSTGDGAPPSAATLSSPAALAVDPLSGDVCWSQSTVNFTIRCASDSRVYRLVGNGSSGAADSADALSASVGTVYGMAFSTNGGECVSVSCGVTSHCSHASEVDDSLAPACCGPGRADGGVAGLALAHEGVRHHPHRARVIFGRAARPRPLLLYSHSPPTPRPRISRASLARLGRRPVLG
jgi:hypothetical protein